MSLGQDNSPQECGGWLLRGGTGLSALGPGGTAAQVIGGHPGDGKSGLAKRQVIRAATISAAARSAAGASGTPAAGPVIATAAQPVPGQEGDQR
jgi:hypothetical protein